MNKFSGNNYKGYATREEAVAKWRDHTRKRNRMQNLVVLPLILLTVIALLLYMIR